MNDTLLANEVRAARQRLSQLGRWYASRPAGAALAELEGVVRADVELERVARTARIDLVAEVDRRVGPFDGGLLSALLEVPRERFVLPHDIGDCAVDAPLPLDSRGLATVSAPHAYLLTFRLLELGAGMRLVELGAGSGYGAALAGRIVGPSGRVVSVEIDHDLAERARRLLADAPNVTVLEGDAGQLAPVWASFDRVAVTFAVDELPDAWCEALPEGGRLVAPVGRDPTQRLVLVERADRVLARTDHGPVRYVRNRGTPFTTLEESSSEPRLRRRGS